MAITTSKNSLLKVLRAIGEDTRVRILHILSFADFSVAELVEILEMGQSRVSRHLKILQDAGLLSSRREGSWVYYGLLEFTENEPASEFLKLVLDFKEEIPNRVRDQKRALETSKQRLETTNSFFNSIASDWESIQEEVLSPKVYRSVVQQYLPKSSDLVIDMGCGAGGLIPYLLASNSKQILGVDSSSEMTKIANTEFGNIPGVRFLTSPLENLSIPDSSADAVVCSMVLHHVSRPPEALSEMIRVLKVGGIFVLVELEKHNQEFMREKFHDLWMGFDQDLLFHWLTSAGLKILDNDTITTNTQFRIHTIKAIKES